ncbi:cytochrome c554 [Candidatus Uabimicrobium amorphum]|uniref:Cytochrome c554 n=1 Tax=Uabimicrobium amorphum TaxID=2596890 RepID=A0A5S9ITF0_UABAM|nr:cytochrome c family protein [Candidatus Uabimicrobium amorphum]BBM87823.1 cytochrome c554 [Candidatus Uabimicrobium amorphum]
MKKLLLVMVFLAFVFADDQQKLDDLKKQIQEIQERVASKKAELQLLKKRIEDKKMQRDAASEEMDTTDYSEEKQKLEGQIRKIRGSVNAIKKDTIKYQKIYKNYSAKVQKMSRTSKNSSSSQNKQTNNTNKNTQANKNTQMSNTNKNTAKNSTQTNKNTQASNTNKNTATNNTPVNKNTQANNANKNTQVNKNTGNSGSKPVANVTLRTSQLEEIKKINAIKNKPVDYKKIVTANKCGECHKQEKQVWQKTPHYKTYNDMSKKPRAKGIFKKLGLKGSIKRSGRCSKCHFTQQHTGRKVKAVMGVSCESCHGAGKDWLLIHNDKTRPKDERRKEAMSLGMNNPVDIYLIAQNCYGCHSVPDEELVNIGGHKAGSAFELVSWSQGMVRHNFVRANNSANAKSSPERIRVMFVTGLMLDLEYALRGLLKVTKPGKYYDTMFKKVDKTYKILKAANGKSGGVKEIQELLTLFSKLNMKNRKHLEAGANLVTLKAREFTKNHTGDKLASLDAFIPKNYK